MGESVLQPRLEEAMGSPLCVGGDLWWQATLARLIPEKG